MFDAAKTKAVLWDLDDTLYSRVAAARQVFPGMFRAHLYAGRDASFIEAAADYMMTQVSRNSMVHEAAFQALIEKFPPDKPYVRADCLDYYYEHLPEFAVPYPEQLEVVKKLKALGIKTAIVTNVASDRLYSQRNKIKALKLESLFDAVVLSGELGVHKPDRRIYDHAAKLLGVPNEACVFVGDDPASDISGALSAGMEAVWIDRWEDEGAFADEPRVRRVESVLEYFEL